MAKCIIPNYRERFDGKGRAPLIEPLDDERPCPNYHGRVSSGTWTITAEKLFAVNFRRPGRTLAGDHRSARANVMQTEDHDLTRPIPIRVNYGDPTSRRPDDHDHPADGRLDWHRRGPHGTPRFHSHHRDRQPPNPNHLSSGYKLIGLKPEWSQTLRIEKWQFPTRINPAYYLICPGTFLAQIDWSRTDIDGIDPRTPPLSTVPAGRKATGCPQRCLKLLMVKCTPEEDHDAMIAQMWIRQTPPQLQLVRRPMIQKLLARYGPIMEPRTLLCPRCLGVRYGNHPETCRQWYWRNRGDSARG